jgi:hypothetical protein
VLSVRQICTARTHLHGDLARHSGAVHLVDSVRVGSRGNMAKAARVVEAALLNEGERRSAVEGKRKNKDAGHHFENVKRGVAKKEEVRKRAPKGAEEKEKWK